MTFALWFSEIRPPQHEAHVRFAARSHGEGDGAAGDAMRGAAAPMSDADRALVMRLRGGDEGALRTIIGQHGPALLRLASAITGSADLGDEVVQQVFVRLWDHREETAIRGAIRQYLWRAVRNQALSVRRHEDLQLRVADELRLAPPLRTAAWNIGAEELEAAALLVQVEAVLRELPRRCREIFLLNWRDALSPAEIADSLGIGLPTVRNQILIAVKHLVTHLAGHLRRL